MSKRSATAEKILSAGRKMFNEKGYAATTLTEIASSIGISQGNLTYHFPTKSELAAQLVTDARLKSQSRRANKQKGTIADDYVEHLLFAMELTWSNRFLLRDRAQLAEVLGLSNQDNELKADYEELAHLLERIAKEGLLRRDLDLDLEQLTRTLWIVSRYWMDYLRESENQLEITWASQERGIEHHFSVLLPCLTASAKKEFTAALARQSDLQRTKSSPVT